MNVQRKRECLKTDIKQVLSRRPDGIPVADFWSEVSREIGYEVREKDYMVPRLSYFFYLWGGEFNVIDDIVYLKEQETVNVPQHVVNIDDDDDDNALANRNISKPSQYTAQHTSTYQYPSTSYQDHRGQYGAANWDSNTVQRPSAMDLMKRTGAQSAHSYNEPEIYYAQKVDNFDQQNYYTNQVNTSRQTEQSYSYSTSDARPSVSYQTDSYSTNQNNSVSHSSGNQYQEHQGTDNTTSNEVIQNPTQVQYAKELLQRTSSKQSAPTPKAMDLLKRTGSEGQVLKKNEFYKPGYLNNESLQKLRDHIIKELEQFPHGIKHKKLYNKCQVVKGIRDKAEKQWGSFLDFLAEQMSDVIEINENKVVCLRRFINMGNQWKEVIDLTEEGGEEQNNETETETRHGQQKSQHPHDKHGHYQQHGPQHQNQPGPSQHYNTQGPSQPFTPHRTSQQNTPQGPSQHQQTTNNQGFSPGTMQPNRFSGAFSDFATIDMKPIEKKEFEKQEVVVIPLNIPRNVQPSPDFIDSVGRECIEMLANANEFVMAERVEKMLFQKFQINHIRQLGVNHITNLPCIFELNRLLNKIHGYVIGFIKTRPVCTLYELKDALKYFIGNIEDFSQLKIGPLQRSPVVFQHFKFPPDQSEIPEITSIDVLEHFRNYMHRENLWSSKPELEPFMNYLVEQYEADSAYYLGVRIISLPLVAWILRRAHGDSMRVRRQAFDYYTDMVRQEVEDAFRKFRACMLQAGDSDDMEVRRHYLRMRPDDVILEVFEKFNYLMTNASMRETNRGHQRKICRVIEEYINLIRDNPICRVMFHLSICMSYLSVEETVLAILNPQHGSKDADSGDTETTRETKPPPRKDKLKDLVKTYIERCLNAGSLSLTHLDRIEEKLLEEFGFADFHLMGYGRFLQFLISDNKQVLEEAGGLVLGSSSGGSAHDGVYKPDQTDIHEFIKQCKACGLAQPSEIETALCKHYRVKELHHLGYGNITRLMSHTDKHKHGLYSDFTVYYQSTLTRTTGASHQNMKVGVLGHQTKDLAKICLHNCPLLEDLAEWSQWSLVFEPELGKLKDFIQKYGGVTNKTLEGGRLATLDFLALETKPGTLLKIVSNTSPELIAEALEQRDIFSFCGHLVSMVIAYKGVNNLPKALISGHIKTALLQLHADEPSVIQGSMSTPSHQHSACQFVLDCLLKIPTDICISLADDLFLSPLGQVVGSTKFKQILVELCKNSRQSNHLAKLGCLLGIQEWTSLVSQKCLLPETSILKVSPDMEEFYGEEAQDEVKEQNDKDDDDDDDDDNNNSADDSDRDDIDEILEGDISVSHEGHQQKAKVTDDGDEVNVIESQMDDQPESGTKVEDKSDKMDFTEDNVVDAAMDKENTGVKVRTCEDIINEIRKDEFGVGVHLSEDGQRLMKVQQERLGRSLDRLSKDLYSKDTHFVLELVQNADDNSYHDNLLNNVDDVCPSVKFVIDDESVSVRNNELGFQEKDIRALCDVGRSTKGKHKFGYIGQKGIGFKSVFRVTDSPEIHSNGYHVKFDVNSGPMGYILPHWSPQIHRVDTNWTTNILLTLKPEMKQQARTLAARFNDIHPSLLLFLHRLREITIENKVESSIQTMRRRDVGDSIVEIQHNSGLDRWLVVKKMLDASKISSQAKSGAEVESTEIALAFPIRPTGQKLSMQRLPPKQLVFAFLPLRSYGFRFIVQGDFDVPSSREDVDRDSSWNQWLRNEIHTLFLDSLDMFKNHGEFSSIEAVVSYLQFVPMEDEILDFFKPVASDILKKLKARPCVPTQPNSQGVTSWKIPSQTVQVRDPLVRSVITPELLQTHLNLHYLHPDVAAMLNPTLTSCLGIETLTSEHLFQIGKALIVAMDGQCGSDEDILLISKWLACMYRSQDEFHDDHNIQSSLLALRMLPLSDGNLVSLNKNTIFFPMQTSENSEKQTETDSDENILLISKWLACMYRSQDEFHDDYNIQSSLLALRMLPLSDGNLVSLNENTIFFPMQTSENSDKQTETDPLYYLQQDVNSLHPVLLKTDDDEVNSQVHKLLTRLGVKQLSPFDMINNHILPVFKSEKWKEKSEATLVSYVTYIKTQTDRQSSICNLDELKDCVQVLTNKGIRSPKHVPVHFSSQYGGLVDLQQSFPGYEWTVIDPVYLPPQCGHLVVLGWHDFFIKLGVEDFFTIQKREICLKKDQLVKSTWKDESCVWPKGASEYILQDYHSEELDSLITHNLYADGERYQTQMRALCTLLDKWWDSKLHMYTRTQVCDNNGRILRETLTSLGILLRTSRWLPVTVYKCDKEMDGSVSQSKLVEMREPAGLYIHSEEVEKLFGDKVPYLDVKLVNNSAFMQFLGLKNSVTIETVKDFLLQWCSRSSTDIPAEICTSLKHMKNVYSYLGVQLNRGDLQNLLFNHPVFFVPSKVVGPSELVAGKMLSRKEIWLSDKTGLFDKHRGLLEEFHSEICKKRTINSFYGDAPELINIFKQEGRIDHQPQIEEYLELLSLLCTTSTPKDASVLGDVLYIFSIIGQALSHVPETSDDNVAEIMLDSMKTKVKRKVQKEKILPTKKGVWVSLNDKPMIADNKDWEKMFVDKEKVHFLDLEDKQKTKKSGQHGTLGAGKSKEGRIQPGMIDRFITICGVKKLSECIKTEVSPSITEACPTLQTHVHQIVPTIQQYLQARFIDVYRQLEQKNTKQMWKNATFLQTDRLEVIYKLTVSDSDISEVRREKCVITPPTFYFHSDHVTSIPEINREISRYLSCGDVGCNTALRSFLSELHSIQSGLTSDTTEMLLQRHEAEGVVINDNEAWEVDPPEIEPGEIEYFPVTMSDSPSVDTRQQTTGMRAWPPVAPVGMEGGKPRAFPERGPAPTTPSSLGPAPQAKDYMRTVKDLPSSVRTAATIEQITDTHTVENFTYKGKDGQEASEKKVQGEVNVEGQGHGQSGSHGNGQGEGQVGATEMDNATTVSRKRKLSETDDDQQKLGGKRIHGDKTDDLVENTAWKKSEGEIAIVIDDEGEAVTNSETNQWNTDKTQTQENKRLSAIKGAPVWTQGTTEYTLDQLAVNVKVPSLAFITQSDGDPDIGRWGESLVAEYLKQEKEAGNIVDFVWHNDEEETGAPYDFIVKISDGNRICENYIEVKSTSSDNKEMFEISIQQIKFAEEKKGCFHIYRVFNAGDPDKVRLARLLDLNLRLSQKQVKLCMFI